MSLAPATRGTACLLLLTIVLSAGGQLAMKVGMQMLASDDAWRQVATFSELLLYGAPVAVWVIAGACLYGSSMLAWLLVLRSAQLSFAYPLLGLSYLLAYFIATNGAGLFGQSDLFGLSELTGVPGLGEGHSWPRLIGTGLVVAGTGLICWRAPGTQKRSSSN